MGGSSSTLEMFDCVLKDFFSALCICAKQVVGGGGCGDGEVTPTTNPPLPADLETGRPTRLLLAGAVDSGS